MALRRLLPTLALATLTIDGAVAQVFDRWAEEDARYARPYRPVEGMERRWPPATRPVETAPGWQRPPREWREVERSLGERGAGVYRDELEERYLRRYERERGDWRPPERGPDSERRSNPDRQRLERPFFDRNHPRAASTDRRLLLERDADQTPPGGERRTPAEVPRGQKLMSGGSRPAIQPMLPQRVAFSGEYAPGTIVIETRRRQLLLVISRNEALRYEISVGREGFAWTGTETISRIADWPDWHPPASMRQREPHLPEKMTGGINNPLGAKALYLGNSLYRIHGTNDPRTIGLASSSGCFRMLNGHVIDLTSRVGVGTMVVVVDRLSRSIAAAPDQRR